jgi:uncharacterized damage-inducible protein DinB
MPDTDSREHADLLDALAKHRAFLCRTAQGLSDEDASRRSTVSELCIGGLIKHVTRVENRWSRFIVSGPVAFGTFDEAAFAEHAASFQMSGSETLKALLEDYAAAAEQTEAIVRSLADLDQDQPLPAAPWWPPGARWSARRVLVHVIAETAQHAGHADIIREAIDGQRTMG